MRMIRSTMGAKRLTAGAFPSGAGGEGKDALMRMRQDLPLGPAPLAIALIALAAGAYLAVHPVRKSTADLRAMVGDL